MKECGIKLIGVNYVMKQIKKKRPANVAPIRANQHVPRNKPCPCGSGIKAKRCCLPRIQQISALPPHIRNQIMVDAILQKPISQLDDQTPINKQSEVNINDCSLTIDGVTNENS